MLNGNTRIHISDLIRIFFSNMIKYSSKEPCKKFSMNTFILDKSLKIVFKNKISEDQEDLNDKINSLLKNKERLQKENGTGLIKAQKIVKYDLNNENNSIKVYAKDGYCYSEIVINLIGITK